MYSELTIDEPHKIKVVEGEGFEPSKAEPSDLQSDPFGHSGTPPRVSFIASLIVSANGGGRRIRTFEGGAVRFTV